MFSNPPKDYFGDEDELDGTLIAFERTAEADDWADALDHLVEDLSLSLPSPPPALPEASFISLDDPSAAPPETTAQEPPAAPGGKRKAPSAAAAAKKSKVDGQATASSANGFVSILKADDLRPPKLLEVKEMEAWIVKQQKAALLAEYLD